MATTTKAASKPASKTTTRLDVPKTYKLFIGGAFPRSESGRTYEAEGQNVARASRKDARDAVQAARKAFGGWSTKTPYNRGQVVGSTQIEVVPQSVQHLVELAGRLRGLPRAFRSELDPLDRIAHYLRPLGMERLAGDDRRAERDDAREQHPAGDGRETVLHSDLR